MKKHVLLYKVLQPDVLALLKEHFEVAAFDGLAGAAQPDFLAALEQAQGLIGMYGRIDAAFIARAPRLQAVATVSVGYDAIDVEALNARRILLCNTPDVLTETTADTAFMLVLGAARRVAELSQWLRNGQWKRPVGAEQYGVDVHGKTLGIVGLGRIGSAVARRAARGFGMRVLYTARSPKAEAERELGAQRRELDALLRESDFVCVLAPLSAQTRHLIGARELALMKPSAFLVNAARGAVVDEQALIAALQERRIAGAGLDVFEQEPLPQESPLLAMPNVLALPHIGSATWETRHAMELCAANNLIDALAGRRPQYLVNPQVLGQP
ncbi:2-hydroxyacid dehydrogenase [Nevskia soli]|uniref:2-hydroxyacid dehydrogenase n=1 Tax=Nevskia soli TaxID=418856 RepID=UPI0004A6F540|nr:D-glycerate dehydrogenase [Nevskia soli]